MCQGSSEARHQPVTNLSPGLGTGDQRACGTVRAGLRCLLIKIWVIAQLIIPPAIADPITRIISAMYNLNAVLLAIPSACASRLSAYLSSFSELLITVSIVLSATRGNLLVAC